MIISIELITRKVFLLNLKKTIKIELKRDNKAGTPTRHVLYITQCSYYISVTTYDCPRFVKILS